MAIGFETVGGRSGGHVLVAGQAAILVSSLRRRGVAVAEAQDFRSAAEALWTDPAITVVVVSPTLSGGSGCRLIDTARNALGRQIEAITLPLELNGPDPLFSVMKALKRGSAAKPLVTAQGETEKLFECLAVAAEQKDNETGHHNRRIGCYAATLAKAMGWSGDRCRTIELAATLHDIGKIGIPDEILFKQGPLTSEERKRMEHHTIAGHQILSAANSPVLVCAAKIARFHHERWCGGGYPSGVAGQNTPLEARLAAVCDVYDALRSSRPYKSGIPHHQTMKIMLEGDGRTIPNHFDPIVLESMGWIASSFESIFSLMTEE